MALEPGPFGSFVLLELLGRGGMGEVWLARPRSSTSIPGGADAAMNLCVLKTMRTETADDPDAVKRFGDEARLALWLAHPRISRVIDAGRVGSTRFMAIELVEGIDVLTLLRRCAEKRRELDEGVALWIGACMLDALSFAHDARHPVSKQKLGVVHRDISPQNVMCSAQGFAHIIDFGLALSSVKRARTAQDVVMGKLGYMAPEQARAEPLDGRCDIFAAGVVLYELLALDPYWGELESKEIWTRVAMPDWKPPRLGYLKPDVARWLSPLIERDPQKRAKDAAERRNALGPLLNQRGGGPAAQKRLGALVEDLAKPELDRIRRSRTAVASLPVMDAPVADVGDAETLAGMESEAIVAALASRTEALPAFNDAGEPRDTLLLPVSDIAPAMAVNPPSTRIPNPIKPSPSSPPSKAQPAPRVANTDRIAPSTASAIRAVRPGAPAWLPFVLGGGGLAVVVVVVVAWALFFRH